MVRARGSTVPDLRPQPGPWWSSERRQRKGKAAAPRLSEPIWCVPAVGEMGLRQVDPFLLGQLKGGEGMVMAVAVAEVPLPSGAWVWVVEGLGGVQGQQWWCQWG